MTADVRRAGGGRRPERAPGEPRLPLELCTGLTPECPHYDCPDGWHAGDAPNCACTPDCALGDDEEGDA